MSKQLKTRTFHSTFGVNTPYSLIEAENLLLEIDIDFQFA